MDYDELFREWFFQKWFPLKQGAACGPVPREIVVLGAGVIGLTTALALRASFGSTCPITVMADNWDKPVSTVAAGFWAPFKSSDERTERLSEDTYFRLVAFVRHCEQLSGESHNLTAAVRAGKPLPTSPVVTLSGVTVDHSPDALFPQTPDYVLGRRPAKPHELPEGYQSGMVWDSVLMQTQLYLPMLRRLCSHAGIRLRKKHVEDADVLAQSLGPGAVVVGCVGLGAATLFNDSLMRPLQGTVLVVPMPDPSSGPLVGHFVDAVDREADTEYAYLLPRSDGLVMGGTGIPDEWSLNIAPGTEQGIRARCAMLLPGSGLETTPALAVKTGLRPTRSSLALGPRQLATESKGALWIDSYGYGGAGWTVSLAAAEAAVDHVRAALRARAKL